jgi:hypothetical protein
VVCEVSAHRGITEPLRQFFDAHELIAGDHAIDECHHTLQRVPRCDIFHIAYKIFSIVALPNRARE